MDSILNGKKLILGSQSPRRSHLLRELDIPFTKRVLPTKEDFSPDMDVMDVAEYLAIKKAKVFEKKLSDEEVVLTADSIVIHEGIILGKPTSSKQAKDYIRKITGSTHLVVTGVCILSNEDMVSFSETARVTMEAITDEELEYYISKYNPLDKAGAYGIQEWIGHAKIKKIEGTYTNIMGLPTQKIYLHLKEFCK